MPKGIYKRIKPVSIGTRKKMSLARKGKFNTGQFVKGLIPWNKGRRDLPKISEEHKLKIAIAASQKLRGSNNGSWKGGISPISERVRKTKKYALWRKLNYERDGYKCRLCGSNLKLVVDHIRRYSDILDDLKELVGIENLFDSAMDFEPLWDLNNGRTLCDKCHKQTENYGRRNLRLLK